MPHTAFCRAPFHATNGRVSRHFDYLATMPRSPLARLRHDGRPPAADVINAHRVVKWAWQITAPFSLKRRAASFSPPQLTPVSAAV